MVNLNNLHNKYGANDEFLVKYSTCGMAVLILRTYRDLSGTRLVESFFGYCQTAFGHFRQF
jgi:hypothetical protein